MGFKRYKAEEITTQISNVTMVSSLPLALQTRNIHRQLGPLNEQELHSIKEAVLNKIATIQNNTVFLGGTAHIQKPVVINGWRDMLAKIDRILQPEQDGIAL